MDGDGITPEQFSERVKSLCQECGYSLEAAPVLRLAYDGTYTVAAETRIHPATVQPACSVEQFRSQLLELCEECGYTFEPGPAVQRTYNNNFTLVGQLQVVSLMAAR